jgi:hypothetical protein
MDQAFMAADPDMTPEERSLMNAYWTAQRTPRPVEIIDNNETGQLTVSDPLLDNVLGDEEWRKILPPKAEGIFTDGTTMNGEVMFACGAFWECITDASGKAILFDVRDDNTDDLEAVGSRIPNDEGR